MPEGAVSNSDHQGAGGEVEAPRLLKSMRGGAEGPSLSAGRRLLRRWEAALAGCCVCWEWPEPMGVRPLDSEERSEG